MTRSVVWFRRDLSLVDNPAVALATTADEVVCAWVVEPNLWRDAGELRRAYLTAAVRSLADEIARRGGRLAVLRGPARDAVPRFAAVVGATSVVWNGDVSAYAQRRDASVRDRLARDGVTATTTWGTLLHPPGSVTTAAGTVPRVFTRFHQLWSALPVPARAVDGRALFVDHPSDADLPDGPAAASASASHAQDRLTRFLDVVDQYGDDRDRPDHDGTSRLSSDLRFGLLTPGTVARAVGTATPGRHALVRQLAWRDFYAHLFFARPDLATASQLRVYDDVAWRNDPDEIAAWRAGRTGYPIVDAAMRQLAATGWVHGRTRMIAASFLVKDLLVDWRVGERHFRRLLVDGDVAQNAGNWQWCAGTGPDAAPYFRVLNPTTQGRRFDPSGDYVRAWVPELDRLTGASVHAPGELGPLDLAAAGVVLGDTYPTPVVDHAAARVRALAAYAAARQGPRDPS